MSSSRSSAEKTSLAVLKCSEPGMCLARNAHVQCHHQPYPVSPVELRLQLVPGDDPHLIVPIRHDQRILSVIKGTSLFVNNWPQRVHLLTTVEVSAWMSAMKAPRVLEVEERHRSSRSLCRPTGRPGPQGGSSTSSPGRLAFIDLPGGGSTARCRDDRCPRQRPRPRSRRG